MTINYTTLLGLAKPVTGTEANTWGTVVNDEITSLLDTAVAGTTTLSADADVTLTTTTGAANQARQAIILWTAGGTTLRTITAPAQSKTYIVINKTTSTQSIKLVGVGPTTGVTIIAGESAVCAWNGVDFIKTGSTIANAAGSNTQVQFNNSGVLGGSSNLTWNGTTLAITGALTATANSTFSSTGALTISKGTTGERPTAVSGMLRFNTTTTEFEGYNGTAWASVGGAALSNDTSTATNVYPLFANATTGTAATLFTSNAKLLYKPSTGEFQMSAPVASNGIVVNSQTVSASYTIAAGFSAMSAGPVTVASGQAVTVSGGSRWVIS
jgi:uncharacterized Zn-binding protein involved in type VI secretion